MDQNAQPADDSPQQPDFNTTAVGRRPGLRYAPQDWYWQADDGRVFASKAAAVVTTSDPGFTAFAKRGGIPTAWPRDDAGAQTDAALDDVLAPHGVSTSGRIRSATGAALLSAMTDNQAKAWQAAVDAATPAVRAYWAGAYRTALPDTSPKLVRLAKAAGIDIEALFAAMTA